MQILVSIQCFVSKIKHFEICDVPDELDSELSQKRILLVMFKFSDVITIEKWYLKSFEVKANDVDGRIYFNSCEILWRPYLSPKERHQ